MHHARPGRERQGVWHTESVEHAADAVDAEAPEGTFAVLIDQLLESAQLLRSSWVKLQFAAFPACPGVGRHLERARAASALGAGAERSVAGRPGPDRGPLERGGLYVTSRSTRARLFHPPRVTRRDDDDRVMKQPIEERNRGRLHWQEVAPFFEWPMTGHAQAATLVRGGHETKQQLGTGVIEGSKAQLVDQNQVVAQQRLITLPTVLSARPRYSVSIRSAATR